MSESAYKENTEPDDLNVGLIATVAIVGALLVVAIAAALTALVRSESSAYGTEVGAFADLGTVSRLKIDQRAKLTAAPAWTDREKGLVSVPIDRAMEVVTTDIARDPNLASVTPPPPAASAAPAEAPSAAAPAEAPPQKRGAPEKKPAPTDKKK